MADFQIFQSTVYNASASNSSLANITGTLASSLIECAQQCLNHVLCQTATHYEQLQICSLYGEKFNLGKLVSTGTREPSVISRINVVPQGKRRKDIMIILSYIFSYYFLKNYMKVSFITERCNNKRESQRRRLFSVKIRFSVV